MCIANVNNDGVYSANVGEGSEISLNIQVEDEMVMMVEVTDVNADEDVGGGHGCGCRAANIQCFSCHQYGHYAAEYP